MEGIKKKAVLVYVGTEPEHIEFLEELSQLAIGADYEVVSYLIQQRQVPDFKFYIGKGKLKELKEVAVATECDVIIFDNTLSSMQFYNLEKYLRVEVMDRVNLIIEIFSRHATSNEGKLQVELMYKQKMLPRILGQGLVLSRQAGGGTGAGGARRGAGEQKLELDKRTIRRDIRNLEDRINKLSKQRNIRRKRRTQNNVKTITLVGYTNSGKSTLMNALTDANVLEEDKPFATLDPTTRKLFLGLDKNVILTDTVGFISRLPHEFVKAFRSTLEEVRYSDLIIHVLDGNSYNVSKQYEVVLDVLKSLEVDDIPIITVVNKIDLGQNALFMEDYDKFIPISAKHNINIDVLKSKINEVLFENNSSITNSN